MKNSYVYLFLHFNSAVNVRGVLSSPHHHILSFQYVSKFNPLGPGYVADWDRDHILEEPVFIQHISGFELTNLLKSRVGPKLIIIIIGRNNSFTV